MSRKSETHNVLKKFYWSLYMVASVMFCGADVQHFPDDRHGPHDGGHDSGHLPQVPQCVHRPVHTIPDNVCGIHPAHQPGGGAGAARRHPRLPCPRPQNGCQAFLPQYVFVLFMCNVWCMYGLQYVNGSIAYLVCSSVTFFFLSCMRDAIHW